MTKLQRILEDSQGCWKTESEFFVWLRSQLRRIWLRHPIKITYKRSKQFPVPEGNKEFGKARLLINCENCGNPFPKSKVQVDHKIEVGSLKSFEDVVQFIYRLIFVSWEDIRCLCKECHAIFTHASRFGLTYEHAKLEKEVITFGKNPAKEQIAILAKLGSPLKKSNTQQRKECYRKHLQVNHERS